MTEPTFPARLAELHAAATPGPWERAEPAGCETDHGWEHAPCRDILSAGKTVEAPPGFKFKAAVISSWGYDADGVSAEDADIDLIVYLRNHTEAILALVEAAEWVVNPNGSPFKTQAVAIRNLENVLRAAALEKLND